MRAKICAFNAYDKNQLYMMTVNVLKRFIFIVQMYFKQVEQLNTTIMTSKHLLYSFHSTMYVELEIAYDILKSRRDLYEMIVAKIWISMEIIVYNGSTLRCLLCVIVCNNIGTLFDTQPKNEPRFIDLIQFCVSNHD